MEEFLTPFIYSVSHLTNLCWAPSVCQALNIGKYILDAFKESINS